MSAPGGPAWCASPLAIWPVRGARLDAFEQAHVLDCDRGLVGEGRDQFDLFVGEGSHFRDELAAERQSDRPCAAWNGQYRAEIAQSLRLRPRVFRINLDTL